MTAKSRRRKKLKQIAVYIYMLIILLSLLTVASYTWFSLSRTPRVSDMYMFVNTESGLELSLTPDAETWELQLDFRDMVEQTTPLRPITWSDTDGRFYAAGYGVDGRRTGAWEPLNDLRNANKNNLDGYYIKASFYARSQSAVDVSLSEAVEVSEGLQGSGTYLIGTPEWNGDKIVHENGGKGGETAVRVGFRITPVNSAGEELESSGGFYIYEPNCDAHITQPYRYVQTQSIDGTDTLVPPERLILQTASEWSEAYPVQRDVVIHELGEFTTEKKLFSLESGEIVRVDMYIWLEGQDIDCTNEIIKAKVFASIQFSTGAGDHSGMVPIEPLPDEDEPDINGEENVINDVT